MLSRYKVMCSLCNEMGHQARTCHSVEREQDRVVAVAELLVDYVDQPELDAGDMGRVKALLGDLKKFVTALHAAQERLTTGRARV